MKNDKGNGFIFGCIFSGFYYKAGEDDDWVYFHVGDGSGELYRIRKDGTGSEQVINIPCCEINIVGDWIYHCLCCRGETLHKIRKDGTELTKLNDDYTRDVVVDGDWVYYCADGMNLYKISTDGTGKTKLNNDACRNIKVLGNWIYYGLLKNYRGIMVDDKFDELYRIRTDGTERTKLSSGKGYEWFRIEGEWIYYYPEKSHHDAGELYRMKLNGKERTKLLKHYYGSYGDITAGRLEVDDEWFCVLCKKGGALYKMQSDGTDKLKLAEQCDLLEIKGDWIYYYIEKSYHEGGTLYKIRKDSTDDTKIDTILSEYSFEIIDEWLYYFNKNGVFKIHGDSTNGIKLCDDICNYFNFNIIGDWIYYENDSENGAFYRIRTDGTGREWLADRQGKACIEEDWIYYVNESDYNKLYKIRPNGTQRTKISDDVFEQLWVFGDWICFLVDANPSLDTEPKLMRGGGLIAIKPSKLYRMRTDGTEKEKICEDILEHSFVIGEWIHYMNISDEKKWYKIKADGTRIAVEN